MHIKENWFLFVEWFYWIIKKTPLFDSKAWENRNPAEVAKNLSTFDLPHRQTLFNYMKKLYAKNSKLEILDVGGGLGVNVINCCDFYINSNFTVLDIQDSAIKIGIELAKIKKISNLKFVKADVRYYNFPTKYYDLIFIDALFLYLNESECKLLLSKLVNSTFSKIVIKELNFHANFLGNTIRNRDGYIHNFNKILSDMPVKITKEENLSSSGLLGRWKHFGVVLEIEVCS
jgi:hypothetical protein